jgi:hypothetical protein
MTREEALHYIESKVFKDPQTGCWIWQGPYSQAGYGRITKKTKLYQLTRQRQIHRSMVFLTRGGIGPLDLVRHTCNNPPCCSPDHLEIGTHIQNMRDMIRPYEELSLAAAVHSEKRTLEILKQCFVHLLNLRKRIRQLQNVDVVL